MNRKISIIISKQENNKKMLKHYYYIEYPHTCKYIFISYVYFPMASIGKLVLNLILYRHLNNTKILILLVISYHKMI